MLAQTYSLTQVGTTPCRICIETDVSNGLPGVSIVGLGNKTISEARERLRSAIRNSHLNFPPRKVVINMAPADIAKSGTGYDLAMAIGILVATKQLPGIPASTCFVAELALNGELRPSRDCLAAILSAHEAGFTDIVVDNTTIIPAWIEKSLTILRAPTLRAVYLHYLGEKLLSSNHESSQSQTARLPASMSPDLSDIKGLTVAKRALEIAAAGHHNLLLIGPPGTGKSLLAQSLLSLLPPATTQERRLIHYLHSLAGQALPHEPNGRPFRAPHASSSHIALVGGGQQPRPGEISLAHLGVLFLDEIIEFSRLSLESLRQPLEDGEVTVSRASDSLTFPARFLLIATMNPCPCGYHQSVHHSCDCSPAQVQRYQQRLSGPLLERFDMICHVQPPTAVEWLPNTPQESSAVVASRVSRAYGRQLARFPSRDLPTPNSRLSPADLVDCLQLDVGATQRLEQIIQSGQLSGRSLSRCQKVARTIADLEGSKVVTQNHLAEALFYKQQLKQVSSGVIA